MTTTASEPGSGASADSTIAAAVALGAGRERRLHPFSWLFVLLAQLREFAFPLIALLVFGSRGDSWEWFGLIGVGALTLLAVVRYYTYRFRVAGGELVIRSGLLHKNVRHIPLGRIQNIALKRTPLHRIFGVAEVRLESAVGGASAEAQMRVLSLRDAHALEVLVRTLGEHAAAAGEDGHEPDHGELLLALPTIELVKLGLTSNRGLLLGAAGLGALSQFDALGLDAVAATLGKSMFGYARELHLGWMEWSAAFVAVTLLVVLAARIVSVLLLLLQYYGFRLNELDGRLSIESGLLTRIRSHAPLRKIQHWTLRESLLHRWFERRSLRVETAVMQVANEAQALADPIPIAPPDRVDDLLRRWLPWLDLDAVSWQPLHPRAWRRLMFWPVAFTLIGSAALTLRFGAPGLLLLILLPWWVLRARRIAAHSSWALTDDALFWRSGWLDRKLSFAEIGKLQGLQLQQSPFDRRHGMATLVADTAGASPFGHRLELHYLREDEARDLYARLGQHVAASVLRW
jgi:putative membrane protein